MVSAIMLNVIMLSVVMLSVIAPFTVHHYTPPLLVLPSNIRLGWKWLEVTYLKKSKTAILIWIRLLAKRNWTERHLANAVPSKLIWPNDIWPTCSVGQYFVNFVLAKCLLAKWVLTKRRGAMLITAVKSIIVYIPVSIESKNIIMDICEVTKTIMPLKDHFSARLAFAKTSYKILTIITLLGGALS